MKADELIDRKRYWIDLEFNTGGEVILMSHMVNFCRVKDPETGEEWETMTNRLSELPTQILKP